MDTNSHNYDCVGAGKIFLCWKGVFILEKAGTFTPHTLFL
jgi:hypothetical protein